ncbi:MAG: transporter [Homoserinimonas sp.]|nr:transporter [Homoserinimonas sp.]
MTNIDRTQRRTVRVLSAAQILGGLGLGATISVGALLAAAVSGSSSWSGMAATLSTLGAALLALPLARFARSRGRRVALSTGAALAGVSAALIIAATGAESFPLLLFALALAGAGSATNLQARFAATDLAVPQHRGRDLSLVVWATTIGAVLGPNLIEPGERIGEALGMPPLTGPFVFTIVAQIGVVLVYWVGLRPDPLLTALRLTTARVSGPPRLGFSTLRTNAHARFAVVSVALSHATMVSMMSMTPVHLYGHGVTLAVVGFTISLHVAGMYALSPVFGWLADRFGRMPMLLAGQALLLGALVTAWVGSESQSLVVVSLVLLGLGWSASTISSSTLLVEFVPVGDRAGVQGVSDLVMNAAGALGGALAGPILAKLGYSGLGLVCTGLVTVVVIWSLARLTPARASASR